MPRTSKHDRLRPIIGALDGATSLATVALTFTAFTESARLRLWRLARFGVLVGAVVVEVLVPVAAANADVTVTVTITGSGFGSVVSSPPGIHCNTFPLLI